MDQKIAQQYKERILPIIPISELNKINSIIKLPDIRITPFSKPRRQESVQESISWNKGESQEKRIVTNLYFIDNYTIALEKPGKEAAPTYKSCRHYVTGEKTNNINDMHPQIFYYNKPIGEDLTFSDMFERIEGLMHSDIFGLEIMGMLLFRNAFMLDHKKNHDGNWRYNPPSEILKILEGRIPTISEIPVRVFLYFFEVLALNEDVKVFTLGHTDFKDYGRINTLLTFVHLMAVLLNRKSLAKFAGSFARPPSGMAPIPKTKIAEWFPLLSPTWNQKTLY
jgi:hypothetical protein